MKTIRAGLLGFTLLSPLTGGALADEASQALARSFVDAIDKLDGWSAKAAAISSDGAATLIKGLAIASDDGAAGVTAEAIRFNDLQSGDVGFSSSSFTFTNISLKGGPDLSGAIPLAVGKGLKASSFKDWVFNPKKPFESIARAYSKLAETELENFVIPTATYTQSLGMPGGKVTGTYADIRYEGLKGGVLALNSVGKISSVTESGDASIPSISMEWEGMSAKNADFKAMARVFDPAAYAGGKGDGKWLTALESGAYGKLTFSSGGRKTATVDGVTFGAMMVRQPEKPFAAAIDELIALGKPDDAAMMAFLDQHLSGFTGWFKFGAMTVNGIEALPPEGGKLRLESARLEDLSADGLKRFALEGFTADGPAFSAKMKLFEVADVVWPSLQAFIKIGKMDADRRKTGAPPDLGVITSIAGSFLDLYPRIGRVALEGVEAKAPEFGEAISLGSYTATMSGEITGPAPFKSTAEIKSLVIPGALLRLDPEAAQIFDTLGYDKLVLNALGNGAYDAGSGDYDTDVAFSLVDGGALKLVYGLGGLTPERIKALLVPILMAGDGEPDPAALLAASAGASLKGFSIRYDDASLAGRLFKLAAQMQGMDEQTLKANAIAMAQLGLSQLKAPDFAKEVVDAISRFLNDPKSITIAIKPSKPLEAVNLMGINPEDPKAAIELIGLSVTAND